MDVGLKLTVTFFGKPEAESAIVGVPCRTVALIVLMPLTPFTVAIMMLGLAPIVKFVADAVIVSVREAVFVTPPPVPVTVRV